MAASLQQSKRDCATFELCGAVQHIIDAKLVPDNMADLLRADIDRVRASFGMTPKYSDQVQA